ncbi:inducible metalloproteinase inhibitor protein-like [Maniola jurtina]|uniref:inducible metalloproteinase inhibitor protein-like n=1 Tax=Maniola jurtina TaxID=191418 RepID=UPI001E68A318|nr:inducible metalloproteinase inhibitor protein-like [Maniola jurtina]
MTYTHIISVLLLVASSAITAELTCGRNEVIDDCPADCPYDYCPKDEYQDKLPCPKLEVCPPAKCKCAFNYRIHENGTCIPTTECPPFECSRPNEEYQSCPPYCPSDDCSQASASGMCPYGLILVNSCSPQCRCIEHYWRKDGVCVPYEECPNVAEHIN